MYKLLRLLTLIILTLALYSCQKESVKARNTLLGRYSVLITETDDAGMPPFTHTDTISFTKKKKDNEIIVYNQGLEMEYMENNTFAFFSGYWIFKIHVVSDNEITYYTKSLYPNSTNASYQNGVGYKIE